jgi:hypothetical protein
MTTTRRTQPRRHLKTPQGRNRSGVPLPANIVARATRPGTLIIASSSSSGSCRRQWAHRRWRRGATGRSSREALPSRRDARLGRHTGERQCEPDDAESGDDGGGGGDKENTTEPARYRCRRLLHGRRRSEDSSGRAAPPEEEVPPAGTN